MTCPSTRGPFATRTGHSLRTTGLILSCALVAAGCGKKGPPLAPFVRVPAPVTAVTPQRFGDDVYLSFTVPEANADGHKPADIAVVEVYAVTSEKPPATEKQREVATLVATLPVRQILPDLPVPENGSAPPPFPVLPGVDRGAAVAVRETLTVEVRMPVELPIEKPVVVAAAPVADEQERLSALVAPPPTQLPRRHYFLISKSPRGRESVPSTPVSVPLESGSSAPGRPVVTHTATDVMITWTPSPDARASTFLLPPVVQPVAGDNATPANVTPKVPAPLPPLPAKALGFNSEATTYQVYDVTPTNASPDNPYGIKLPAPLPRPVPAPGPLAVPLGDTEFAIKAVTFGVERCFEVRPVDKVFGATVIGPPSPRACITPQDTFPPAAPKNLAAVAGSGVINLIWDGNTESDLAGYLVLRGDAAGGTLQAITPEPVTVTSYRDESVRAGTRYVYVVVAVDRAVPQNVSPQSNRAEETARQ